MIPSGFISELLERIDIIDVIGGRIGLRKNGKNHSALCPFHNENTPSFSVNQQKQFYYCFGCGASGDAIKFVMEYDGLDFSQAVDQLAAMAGMEVPREQQSAAQQQQQSLREQLFERMNQAKDYFRWQLSAHNSRQQAIQYFQQRGLSAEVAKQYHLGFAPEGWDNLIQALSNSDDDLKQLVSLGLVVFNQDKNRHYDFFRERVIFPIRDRRGRTLAFGGRILGPGKVAKYLNSPESPIFHKNQELYGLFEAKQSGPLERLVVVEGYMDVIALAQAGIPYAVATLGTATSQSHIERLQSQVKDIHFCFDGDLAGQKAAWRALEASLPVIKDGHRLRFTFLPAGEDPDSLVRQEGKTLFEQRLQQGLGLTQYLLQQLAEQHPLADLEGKAAFAQASMALIGQIQAPLLKSLLSQEVQQLTGLGAEQLAQLAAQANKLLQAQTQTDNLATQLPASHPPSQNPPRQNPAAHPVRKHQGSRLSLPLRLAALMLRHPKLAAQQTLPTLGVDADSQACLAVKQLLQAMPDADMFIAASHLREHGLGQLVDHLSQSEFFALLQNIEDTDQLSGQFTQIHKRIGLQGPDAELSSLTEKIKNEEKLSPEEQKRYTELIISRKRKGVGR